MPRRQFCTPHIVTGSAAVSLERVMFDDRTLREGWFQKLLFENPTLIPVDDIEPVFGPLIPLARELQTGKGPVDIVCINPEGYITLVETKLFRNPDARRDVVAQIIEYATGMAKWTYADLCDAMRKMRRVESNPPTASKPIASDDDPIIPLVQDQPGFDEARFIDNVAINLRKGRFLLLIVGDGIQEGVEELARTLEESPHLGFTLALVETAVYKMASGGAEYLVHPHVLARTREVVRFVVEVRNEHSTASVTVKPPKVIDHRDQRPTGITETAFFEQLKISAGTPVADFARSVLDRVEQSPDLRLTWSKEGPLIWWESDLSEEQAGLIRLRRSGEVSGTNSLSGFCARNGLPMSIAEDFQNGLVRLLPGTRRMEKGAQGYTQVLDAGGTFPKFAPLAAKPEEFWNLLTATTHAIAGALPGTIHM